MNAKTRTTAALLGAAGTVAVAAFLLNGAETSAKLAAAPSPRCGPGANAHAEAKLAHGKLAAGMAAGVMVRGGGGDAHAAFELTTDTGSMPNRPPLDLALVIDRSGSMGDGRLDHAKSAAIGIVERLGAQDHVALVQYDDTAQVAVRSLAMDSEGKDRLHKAIQALNTGGGTNLHAGLVLGRDEVQRAYASGQVSRVILLSDGHANEGITDTARIADTARDAANHGVRITSVGIGLDFNEDLMEAIAEAGRGNYHYVKEAADLERVVAGELAGVQATVATNVELRLSPACAGVEITEVHGYESRRDGSTIVVPMADLTGGDSRKLVVSMKLPDAQRGRIGTLDAELVYRDTKGGELQRKQLRLGVEVSDDKAAALASIDQSVMAQVLQLQAAQSMRQAAQAYESGDTDGAVRILDKSSHEIEQKRAMYKVAPAKTANALSGLDEMSKQAKAYKPGSLESKDMLKTSKAKARVMSKK